MRELVIDFETHDPHLKTLGAGWATGLGEILCTGMQFITDGQLGMSICDGEPALDILKHDIKYIDVVIAHNAQYDVGYICQLMGGTDWFKDKVLVDTVILAKLYNNIEVDYMIPNSGYNLDFLAKKYLKQDKATGTLGDIVLKHKLINCKDHTTKLSKTKADKYAKSHMKELYELEPEIVRSYCAQDVKLCNQLYNFYKKHISWEQIVFFSDLLKVLIKSRWRGVKVNSEALYDIKVRLQKQRDEILLDLKQISGNEEFNPLSTADVSQVLLKTMKNLPMTAKGNISMTSAWLKEQENPICKKIAKYRMLEKLSRDFCDNILKMQSILPDKKKGFIYPTFNILGAETGRMSCEGPNLQQIPNAEKHKEIGPLIRGAYAAETGKLWASLDFSAQEPRLQVHYASLIGAEGANVLVQEYNHNPDLDLHQTVADLTGVTRNEAKAINLGLAYGMGITKLGASLGLSQMQAKILLENFHTKLPYLRDLDKKCKDSLKKNKQIVTIGGRKLKLDKPIFVDGKEKTFEYKALNKLIQGSSSDQIMMCLIALDKQGFTVISSIHDEINLEVSGLEEALKAKKIMENTLKLKVPVVSELCLGETWGSAKKIEVVNEVKSEVK